jgi:phosphoserine phosphatase
MSHVLTLIAKPLTGDHVRLAQSVLPNGAPPDWLADGLACDLRFNGPVRGLDDQVRALLAGAAVDIFSQPESGRRKRLLVADMDSTIITAECIDEMADLLGLRAQVAAITERAMAGELDFPAALRERALMLQGLDQTDLQSVFDQRIHLTPGAAALVATMTAHGAYTALVSGGFTFFTSRVAAAAGFDHHQANELELVDGRLTGRVVEPILGAAEKLAALQALAATRNIGTEAALAVGDGANDLAMIQGAGLGVAYHAKAIVAEAAAARIDHGDLTALLYLQGYRAHQIKT